MSEGRGGKGRKKDLKKGKGLGCDCSLRNNENKIRKAVDISLRQIRD